MSRAKVSLPSQANLTIHEEALRIDVFWEALKNYSLERVVDAFNRAFKEFRWFPKPVEIIDFIENENNYKLETFDVDYQIEWQEPTEEGRRIAREMIQGLTKKWEDEDKIRIKERIKVFEKNREKLKKQARLLRG